MFFIAFIEEFREAGKKFLVASQAKIFCCLNFFSGHFIPLRGDTKVKGGGPRKDFFAASLNN